MWNPHAQLQIISRLWKTQSCRYLELLQPVIWRVEKHRSTIYRWLGLWSWAMKFSFKSSLCFPMGEVFPCVHWELRPQPVSKEWKSSQATGFPPLICCMTNAACRRFWKIVQRLWPEGKNHAKEGDSRVVLLSTLSCCLIFPCCSHTSTLLGFQELEPRKSSSYATPITEELAHRSYSFLFSSLSSWNWSSLLCEGISIHLWEGNITVRIPI